MTTLGGFDSIIDVTRYVQEARRYVHIAVCQPSVFPCAWCPMFAPTGAALDVIIAGDAAGATVWAAALVLHDHECTNGGHCTARDSHAHMQDKRAAALRRYAKDVGVRGG